MSDSESKFVTGWVLLIDLMGVSDQICNKGKRDRIASEYERVVESVLSKSSSALAPSRLANRWLRHSNERNRSSRPEVAARVETDLKKNYEDHHDDWRRRARIFSDSFFMFFDDVADMLKPAGDSARLDIVAMDVSRQLWASGLPHRGAIVHGDYYLNLSGTVFLGDAIVRAHGWEKAQKWLGISIHPESVKSMPADWSKSFIDFEAPVKRKDGPRLERVKSLRVSLGQTLAPDAIPDASVIDGFLRAHRTAGSANEVHSKYVATAKYFRECGAKHPELIALTGSTS